MTYETCAAENRSESTPDTCIKAVNPTTMGFPSSFEQAQAICGPNGFLAVLTTDILINTTKNLLEQQR